MPTVRARPAKPVRVKAALIVSITANSISMFKHQGDVGHHAGEAVVPEHEQRHEDRGDDHRVGALVDRVAAQRGAAVELADRLLGQRGGQAAGVEHVHQVLHFLLGERSR